MRAANRRSSDGDRREQGAARLFDDQGRNSRLHEIALGAIDRSRLRVNAVAPGAGLDPLNPADRPPQEVAKFGAGTAMGRAAQPEEIAPAFVFMAAPSCSSYVTGEILPIVDGYG